METANTATMLIRYFQTSEKPVGYEEFRDFWRSLTFNELKYFRWVNLETGLCTRY
jgi:hypothetical protein